MITTYINTQVHKQSILIIFHMFFTEYGKIRHECGYFGTQLLRREENFNREKISTNYKDTTYGSYLTPVMIISIII